MKTKILCLVGLATHYMLVPVLLLHYDIDTLNDANLNTSLLSHDFCFSIHFK